jgi:hypothetical protein
VLETGTHAALPRRMAQAGTGRLCQQFTAAGPQLGHDFGGAEVAGPDRRQLQCQWHAFDCFAQCRHGGRFGGEVEARTVLRCTVRVQLDGIKRLGAFGIFGAGPWQAVQQQQALMGNVQPRPRGCDHLHPRCRGEHTGQDARRQRQVFQVVQAQAQAPAGELAPPLRFEWHARVELQPQVLGDTPAQIVCGTGCVCSGQVIGDVVEGDRHGCASWRVAQCLHRPCQKACFSDAARTDDRDPPASRIGQRVAQLVQFCPAPDERACLAVRVCQRAEQRHGYRRNLCRAGRGRAMQAAAAGVECRRRRHLQTQRLFILRVGSHQALRQGHRRRRAALALQRLLGGLQGDMAPAGQQALAFEGEPLPDITQGFCAQVLPGFATPQRRSVGPLAGIRGGFEVAHVTGDLPAQHASAFLHRGQAIEFAGAVQDLAQIAPRGGGVVVGPQQRGQPFAADPFAMVAQPGQHLVGPFGGKRVQPVVCLPGRRAQQQQTTRGVGDCNKRHPAMIA